MISPAKVQFDCNPATYRRAGWTLLFLFLAICGRANNLRFSDLELLHAQRIVVSVSWDHAWRLDQGPANHDAVWIFGKKKTSSGNWEPLLFAAQGHAVPQSQNSQVDPVQDGMGLFLVPKQTGGFDLEATRLELELASPLGADVEEIRLFGIEMVWVPEGPFWLGDGQSTHGFLEGGTNQPLRVLGDGPLPVGDQPGTLSNQGDQAPTADLPAAWPNGHRGFYCMKYELGQEQYADFLNCLTYQQQTRRTATPPSSPAGTLAMTTGNAHRNSIRISRPGQAGQPASYGCDLHGNGSYFDGTDGRSRACNFLNWEDLCAYLDWAGLSPMTEFEYEKACRGPLAPVPGEFAWGTDQVTDANTLVADGTASEGVHEMWDSLAGLASHGYDGPQGPLRAGFGTGEASNRLQAGAGHSGALELSGNLWEQCIRADGDGLRFAGSNGDGRLTDLGTTDQSDWPDHRGGIFRGGGWNSGILPGFRDLAVSDRFYADLFPELRRSTTGGRGVRR